MIDSTILYEDSDLHSCCVSRISPSVHILRIFVHIPRIFVNILADLQTSLSHLFISRSIMLCSCIDVSHFYIGSCQHKSDSCPDGLEYHIEDTLVSKITIVK